MSTITAEQIRDYTALAVRYSELVSKSGSRWQPKYAAELEELSKKIADMRRKMLGGEEDAGSLFGNQR